MRPDTAIRKLIISEDGSFAGTVVFLVIFFAIIGIAIIDGSSVFYANQAASEVSHEAANLASTEYQLSRSDVRAESAAVDYCEAKGLEFINFQVNLPPGHSYTVTCAKDAKTYVFKYLPYFKEIIHQEDTNTSSSL